MTEEFVKRNPKIGYVSDAKQKYREEVWSSLLDGKSVDNISVACLPSANGIELDLLDSIGIRDIVAIDESPAVIASAWWRKRYPHVRCYGSKLDRAAERMAKNGEFPQVVNLDLCNNISDELFNQISSFITKIRPDRIAVTITKGREPKTVSYLLGAAFPDENPRAAALRHFIGSLNCVYSAEVQSIGEYRHSRTPMLWVSLDIKYYVDKAVPTGELVDIVKKVESLGKLLDEMEGRSYELQMLREGLINQNQKKKLTQINDELCFLYTEYRETYRELKRFEDMASNCAYALYEDMPIRTGCHLAYIQAAYDNAGLKFSPIGKRRRVNLSS